MTRTVTTLSAEFEDFKLKMENKLKELTEGLNAAKIVLTQNEPGEVNELRKEIVEMKKSMNFMNTQFEAAKKENELLVANNKHLKESNDRLSARVAHLEQYSRLNNIEIRNVPVTKGENCTKILELIGEKIECPVTTDDVETVHRVPTRTPNQMNIIARFRSRDKRFDFVAKARKARLTSSALGLTVSKEFPIFVNEHLTQDNKALLAKCRELKKENNWMYVWTDNCVIKARKTTDSKVYRILSEANLNVFNN